MLATYDKLFQEAERLTALVTVDPNASSSKRRRAREARKLEARVKAALDEGRIEDDIPGVKLEKVYSPESTKQAMVARVRVQLHPHEQFLTIHPSRRLFLHCTSTAPCTMDNMRPKIHATSSSLKPSTSLLLQRLGNYQPFQMSRSHLNFLVGRRHLHRKTRILYTRIINCPLSSATLDNIRTATTSVTDGNLDHRLQVPHDSPRTSCLVSGTASANGVCEVDMCVQTTSSIRGGSLVVGG